MVNHFALWPRQLRLITQPAVDGLPNQGEYDEDDTGRGPLLAMAVWGDPSPAHNILCRSGEIQNRSNHAQTNYDGSGPGCRPDLRASGASRPCESRAFRAAPACLD